MKVVIQRVKKGAVLIDGKIFSQIEKGYVILVGFCQGDHKGKVEKMAEKIFNLRIMADENGKMNYNLSQVDGEVLVVSQFTLCAETSQRRPSFIYALKEDEAKILYDYLIELLKNKGLSVKAGKFGAYMTVEIINDGPVTIVIHL
jgi:D-tyrosyl-tRNA(Tyr) deacylase